jgi:hypothetical protein
MSLGISARDIQTLHHSLARRRDQAHEAKTKKEVTVGTVVRTALVGGSAMAIATVQTRFPSTLNVGPVPTAFGLAALLHAAGFLGWGGKYDEALHAAGDGVFAYYLATVGAGIGTSMAAKAAATTTAVTKTSGFGALGGYGYSGYRPQGASTWRRTLSAYDLHNLAQQRRAAGVHVAPQAGVHPYAAGVHQAGVHSASYA